MLTDQQHPITPSEGLIEALRSQAPQCDVDAGVNKVRETQLIIAAYRAGADYELEEILFVFDSVPAANIRAWRRPKPPSLAEQALKALQDQIDTSFKLSSKAQERVDLICAALERLQELENND